MVDLGAFNRLRTFGDYSRVYNEEERQFQERKALMEAKKAAMDASLRAKTSDPEFIAAQSLQEYYRTGQLPEGGLAAIQTLAAMQGEKTSYEPDAFGNIKAVTRPNPYKQILGQFEQPVQNTVIPVANMSQAEAAVPRSNALQPRPAASSLAEYDVTELQRLPEPEMPMQQPLPMQGPMVLQQQMQRVDPEVAQSPMGRMEVFKEGLGLAGEEAKQRMQADMSPAQKAAETFAVKKAESQVAGEKQQKAAERVLQNMEIARQAFEKASASGPSRFASDVAEYLGYITKNSEANAVLDQTLPFLVADLKSLTREAGEGTFSEGDRMAIEKMTYNSTAPLPVKKTQYDIIKGAMERYLANTKSGGGMLQQMKSAGAPGFKFLELEGN